MILKTIPFTLVLQKLLSINSTEYVQDLYDENYKPDEQNPRTIYIWRDSPCSCIGRLTIATWLSFPILSHKFNEISVKTPASFFVHINKVVPKFLWRGKRPRIANMILKNKVRELILPNFKTYE